MRVQGSPEGRARLEIALQSRNLIDHAQGSALSNEDSVYVTILFQNSFLIERRGRHVASSANRSPGNAFEAETAWRASKLRSGREAGETMSDWFHELPVTWMALLVFGFTFMLALAIHARSEERRVGKEC